jgi:HAD superfamily hydrolase (TIGR01549 family)
VSVPSDWSAAYAEPHVDIPEGAELSLADHVAAALASRRAADEPEASPAEIEGAVLAAFDANVRTCEGAPRIVAALAERTPVGVLSNCSVPGLAERVLARSAVDESAFDAIVTSVGCGWRKPDPRAFEAAARELGVEVGRLLHVGDDPETDGGATAAGATGLLLDDIALGDLPRVLEDGWG